MEEELSCDCPHCGNRIVFDEFGDPVAAAELSPAERRGVRGLVVEEAVPNWQHDYYHSNNQAEKNYLKFLSAQPFGAGSLAHLASAPIEDDAAPIDEADIASIAEANQADLKERNLLTN